MKLLLTADTDNSLWKATKFLKRPKTQAPPIHMVDGTWARDNTMKADLVAEYVASTFQPHARQSADEFIPEVDNRDNTSIVLETASEFFTEITKNVSSRKAP